jgi:thiol-disulfide isomerase/thioredoxin
MKKLLLFLVFLTTIYFQSNISEARIIIPNDEVLNQPLPYPYEGKKITTEELFNFIDKNRNLRQSIIIFGANWCPDCRILEGTLMLPTVKEFINKYYSILHIDVGKYDINMSLIEILGLEGQKGIPKVLIFDKKGMPVNLATSDRWYTARESKTQEIFDYFQKYSLR